MDVTTCTCNAGNTESNEKCLPGKNLGPPCPSCGNPVNPGNGNKYEQQEIFRGLNGFELSISYNTFDTVLGRFGPRWNDTYDRRILVDGSNRVAHRPDGKAFVFVPGGSGVWVADAGNSDRLIELPLPTPPGPKWELRVADGELVETYNQAGVILSIRARSGLTQTIGFADGTGGPSGTFLLDANGNPTTTPLAAGTLFRVFDHFGRMFQFDREVSGRARKITDSAGGIYRFTYDADANLTSITFPDSKVRTYVYNEPAHTGGATFKNALTGIIDENGDRYATFQYDAKQRTVQTEHAGGANRYIMSYGTSTPTTAAPTSVTDPLNVTRAYTYESIIGALKNTGVTGSVCPGCGPESATFDANSNPASRTDWNGNRTNSVYDLTRNLETSRTEGLTSGGATTPATRTIEKQWHASFRLPTQITEKDAGGAVLRTTGMSYDASGNMLTRTITAGASARTWNYTYNANGSVLTIDGPRTDVADVTTYTYYPNDDPDFGKRGNVATITNAAGHVTQITAYNAHGQPLTIVDPNGLTTTLAYDARQRLTSRDVGGETTTYEYDGVGQLTKVILPDGSFLSYSYDAAHRLAQISDNLGNRIAYALDAMGNRTQEQVFDPVNALAQTRSRVYSNLNRLAQEIGAQSQVTAYGYDNQGNVTSIDGPLAGAVDVTTNAYDALNRLVRVTDPNAGRVNYGYNALDQLTSVTDPRSLVTSYSYDGLNNLNQQVSPDAGTTSNTYDAAGNLLTQTDAKGQVTTHAYDELNRVTSIAYQGGATHTYEYDQGVNGLGRLTQIIEPNSTTRYVYDQKGRLTSETRIINAVSYVTSYSYDSAGRMTGMTYPSGRQVTYTLDSLGRIQQIVTTKDTTQTVVSSVAYLPFGPAQGFTFGNGQTYTRGFDQDGRIASYTLGSQSFAVGYDAASRIGFISDIGNPANSNTYSYDNLDRLTNAVAPGTPFAYSYDAVGNRLTKTVGSSTDNYAYGATSNRLASITPGAGPLKNYVHDAVGSVTADGANTYAYDARGRLIQAVSVVGTSNYQINSLGQRIAKLLPGGGGSGGGATLYSDTFPGPEGRAIDDQADGLWKGAGAKQIAARVIGGQAEIAPRRHIRSAADFTLPSEGLVLQAKLTRGKVALLNVAQDEGLIVRYAGTTIAVARARDDDGDDLADDANVRARFELSSPGAVLQLVMELKPGAGRVRITAGAQSFDSGEIALGGVQAGERYRIRLAAVKLKSKALSGLVDDVLLTVTGGEAPLAVTTHFVYDTQGKLIGEYTGQGALMREYAYLQDLPLALFEPSGAVFFVHTDHLDTPRVITNQAAQIVWRWDNTEPFGNSVPDENPSGLGNFTCNLRFPGTYADKETGTLYNYFRQLDPAIGRYLQFDPIGLRGGINGFAYVGSNPLSFMDPYGLAATGSGGLSTRYGNWCGKNWSGGQAGRIIPKNPAAPVDSLDACCSDHDYCYAKYECDNKCMPDKEKKTGKANCDDTFVNCLDKLKGKAPQNWPEPPKSGTETEAYFFCQKAKWWFKD